MPFIIFFLLVFATVATAQGTVSSTCIWSGTVADCLPSAGLLLRDQRDLRLGEAAANGANYVALRAPATLGGDVTLTLPADDGDANEFLQTNGSGVLTWEPVDASTDITGVLPLANGGTNKNATAVNGGLVWSDTDSLEITSAGTAQQWVLSGGAGTPTMSNTTTTGKLVDGSADEVQWRVQGNGTQTNDIYVVEQSDGDDLLAISNTNLYATPRAAFAGTDPGISRLGIFNSSGANGTLLQLSGGSTTQNAILGTVETDSGGSPALQIDGRTNANGSISTRPIVQFTNNNAIFGEMAATGAWTFGPTSGTANITHLALNNSTSAQQVLYVKNLSTNTSSDGLEGIVIQKGSTTNTTSQFFLRFEINAGGTSSGRIVANGAGQAAFATASDRRLKKNIKDLPRQLDNILALKPVEFEYITGGGSQTGFIAQDIKEIYPEDVSTMKDGMLQVTGWSRTETRLVQALQDLHAELVKLKAELDLLKKDAN